MMMVLLVVAPAVVEGGERESEHGQGRREGGHDGEREKERQAGGDTVERNGGQKKKY